MRVRVRVSVKVRVKVGVKVRVRVDLLLSAPICRAWSDPATLKFM